jgi:signal transduction histidine kinase
LEVIHGEVLRLEQTVQCFLDFARLPAPRRSICDLWTVVNQAADLVRAHAQQQQVDLVLQGWGRPLWSEVDAGQMRTVLINLFLNALEAMPHGGRLEVELSTGERRRGANLPDHCLRVRDNGPGIPAEMLPRLFTPFASSKSTGTGLGLSISRRIVEEHDGQLSAANRPEGGACFTITVPAVEAPDTPVQLRTPRENEATVESTIARP